MKLTGGGQASGQTAVILVAVLAATEQALLVVTVVVDARIGPVTGLTFGHHGLAHPRQ